MYKESRVKDWAFLLGCHLCMISELNMAAGVWAGFSGFLRSITDTKVIS